MTGDLTMRDIARLGHAAQRAKYGDDFRRILGRRGGEAFNRKYITDPRYGQLNTTVAGLNPHDDEADQHADDYEVPL